MATKVSVKRANDVDATNAYTVTVTEYGQATTHHVHTGPAGKGLWIDGKQVEGNMQFNAGKNPSSAIRRYFTK